LADNVFDVVFRNVRVRLIEVPQADRFTAAVDDCPQPVVVAVVIADVFECSH
jgi:hypothetical protein